jgi:hypothetical protein
MPKTRYYSVSLSKICEPGNIEHGLLIACEKTLWVWLKNSSNVTIKKGAVSIDFITSLELGKSFPCLGYLVTIVKERESRESKEDVHNSEGISTRSVVSATAIESSTTQIVSETDTIPLSRRAQLDHCLLRVMKPHQIQAATFILKRLLDDNESDNNTSNHSIPQTGAILADDVGTGKTLIAISVIWALCRHGLGKGIIVCPSSLINNWRQEIIKWLPNTLGRSALFVIGGKGSGSQVLLLHTTMLLLMISNLFA